MTFNTYLRCTKIILRIVYSFRTNRMNSKNILNHLKPKNKISDNSFKNKKFISNINNHKSQYRLFHQSDWVTKKNKSKYLLKIKLNKSNKNKNTNHQIKNSLTKWIFNNRSLPHFSNNIR